MMEFLIVVTAVYDRLQSTERYPNNGLTVVIGPVTW